MEDYRKRGVNVAVRERASRVTSDLGHLHGTLNLNGFSMFFGQIYCGAHILMPIYIVLSVQNSYTACNSLANEKMKPDDTPKISNIKTLNFRVLFAGAQHY